MFEDWLVCIFSYNRGILLDNVLCSIRNYYPEMGIAIFDDQSDDEATISILDRERQLGTPVVVYNDTDAESKHGHLYALMNTAIRYAADNTQYRYAYYVQDDMQFLWRDEQLPDSVAYAFEQDECLMCNSNFLQKVIARGIGDRLPKTNKERLFSFYGNGVADTGIICLEKARKVQLHFPHRGESANGRFWFERGYRLYWIPTPHLAWTPYPVTFRFRSRGRGSGAHVLLPLTSAAIAKLKRNAGYAYLEDYTRTRHFLWKPYWYAASPGRLNLFKIYIRYYLHRIRLRVQKEG